MVIHTVLYPFLIDLDEEESKDRLKNFIAVEIFMCLKSLAEKSDCGVRVNCPIKKTVTFAQHEGLTISNGRFRVTLESIESRECTREFLSRTVMQNL